VKAVYTLDTSFEQPLAAATSEVINDLSKPTLKGVSATIKRWDALRDFRDILDDIKSGQLDPLSTLPISVINGNTYYVLEKNPWVGYFIETDNPDSVVGILFIEMKGGIAVTLSQTLASIRSQL
jgi:hypothetical protein